MADDKLTNEAQPKSFKDVVLYCAGIPEFVQQFNRLTGCQLAKHRTPLEIMIDEATGHPVATEEDMAQFVAFVYEVVWSRLPKEAFADD